MSNIIFPSSNSNQVLKQEKCYGIDLVLLNTSMLCRCQIGRFNQKCKDTYTISKC
jgi:hypothetical protein